MQFSFTGQWSPQFWITWNMWVCNDQCVAGRPAKGKNFNIMIFSDTMNMINVKLCMMVVLIELSHSYHFQWPWLYFKVTAVSNSFNWKFYVLVWLSWNLYSCWLHQVDHEYTTFFFFHTCSRNRLHISSFEKKNLCWIFLRARSFNFAWS